MKIHFIGIGGIGVSALAKYYLEKGFKVTGSDLVSSNIVLALKKQGAKIFLGHKASNLSRDVDLVIHSLAVKQDSPELKAAKKYKIERQTYAQALGELTKKYFTIAVAGTHGKSTTTAMLGLLLAKAGFDPTVIVGTKIAEFENSNCRVGKSEYLVIEACEYGASFLNYWPQIIVVTNIEEDHLDYYENLENILGAFKDFISHLSKDGVLIVNKDDKNIRFKGQGFSLKQKEAKTLKKILRVPGDYNVYNALAALSVARVLGIPDKVSFKALSGYKGSWRRFEIRKMKLGPLSSIISDYAHHPTEIISALRGVREKYPNKEIWSVFQPHQYQRTFYLFDDFVRVFKEALESGFIDKLIITDVYDVAGREEKKIKEKTNSKKMIKAINSLKASYLKKEKILSYLKKNLKGKEVVIVMGAGDIDDVFHS